MNVRLSIDVGNLNVFCSHDLLERFGFCGGEGSRQRKRCCRCEVCTLVCVSIFCSDLYIHFKQQVIFDWEHNTFRTRVKNLSFVFNVYFCLVVQCEACHVTSNDPHDLVVLHTQPQCSQFDLISCLSVIGYTYVDICSNEGKSQTVMRFKFCGNKHFPAST